MRAPEMLGRQAVVQITDRARAALLGLRAEDPQPESLALWLEVTGTSGDQYTYNMYFDLLEHARPDDVVQHRDDLAVVVPAGSVDMLCGAMIDASPDSAEAGWVITNPNSPSPAVGVAGGDVSSALTGDVAHRVGQVLELQINPSIAAHGGQAELVAVEGDTVYLRLSGGCQGCGMARVTLGQGIEVAIKGAVPEVSRIVDVTDHAAGTNPYFEPSKA